MSSQPLLIHVQDDVLFAFNLEHATVLLGNGHVGYLITSELVIVVAW